MFASTKGEAKPGFHIFPMAKIYFFLAKGTMAQCPPKYATDSKFLRMGKQSQTFK